MRNSRMGKGAFLLISFGICFLFFLVSCGGNDVPTSPFAEFSAPVAEFSASPTTGNAPLTVAFTDLSAGVISTWSWDFGDGGTSAEQNPSHDYVTAGTYTVSLTVTGLSGTDTNTKVDHINVTPFAEFSASPTTGNAPLTVDFSDLSTGGIITSWSWDFGDGGTSMEQNPSHIYAEGTYTVSLTVTGPDGTNTNTKPNFITVGPLPPPPVAGFSASPITGNAPLTVAFTDLSTGVISTWSWDFGDGGTSAEQNPSHDYVTAGTYTVSLTVTGPGGTDTDTKVDHINVTSPVFTDDFNRVDSSSPGANWTVVTGTANIVSNQLMPSTYNTKLHWNAGSSDPDQYSQAKQHGTDWRAVTVRGTGVGANYLAYAAWISGSSGSVSLRIGYTIGTDWGAYLDAGTTTLTWTDGDVLRLEATGQDTNIVLRVYQNGILRKTLVYADFSDQSRVFNSGQPGLFTLNASSAIHDDWEGGNL